ncbi:MAG: hypothetical protein JWM11_3929 [Planctomycetaceae bacterium]|nr:hypothetical protein [Planctomycetaceae bacterium]
MPLTLFFTGIHVAERRETSEKRHQPCPNSHEFSYKKVNGVECFPDDIYFPLALTAGLLFDDD